MEPLYAGAVMHMIGAMKPTAGTLERPARLSRGSGRSAHRRHPALGVARSATSKLSHAFSSPRLTRFTSLVLQVAVAAVSLVANWLSRAIFPHIAVAAA